MRGLVALLNEYKLIRSFWICLKALKLQKNMLVCYAVEIKCAVCQVEVVHIVGKVMDQIHVKLMAAIIVVQVVHKNAYPFTK